jgi:anti-sigma28 factor (negative regulator of flagellin synthesis)
MSKMTFNPINKSIATKLPALNPISKATDVYKTAKTSAVTPKEQFFGDEIRISQNALAQNQIDAETKKITAEIQGDSAVSSSQITSLASQVANGTYNIPAENIASALLARFI